MAADQADNAIAHALQGISAQLDSLRNDFNTRFAGISARVDSLAAEVMFIKSQFLDRAAMPPPLVTSAMGVSTSRNRSRGRGHGLMTWEAGQTNAQDLPLAVVSISIHGTNEFCPLPDCSRMPGQLSLCFKENHCNWCIVHYSSVPVGAIVCPAADALECKIIHWEPCPDWIELVQAAKKSGRLHECVRSKHGFEWSEDLWDRILFPGHTAVKDNPANDGGLLKQAGSLAKGKAPVRRLQPGAQNLQASQQPGRSSAQKMPCALEDIIYFKSGSRCVLCRKSINLADCFRQAHFKWCTAHHLMCRIARTDSCGMGIGCDLLEWVAEGVEPDSVWQNIVQIEKLQGRLGKRNLPNLDDILFPRGPGGASSAAGFDAGDAMDLSGQAGAGGQVDAGGQGGQSEAPDNRPREESCYVN